MMRYSRIILPGRGELISIRRKIALAQRAHNLLKLRRDALLRELVRAARLLKPENEKVESRRKKAEEEMMAAIIMAGTAGVTLAAFSIEETPEYSTGYRNVIGLEVPVFQQKNVKKSLDERGYGLLGTSSVIDDAADAWEDLVEEVIRMAELRVSILLLIQETDTLRRRVNALEKILIPDLIEREKIIESMRDEREREDFNRIFMIKQIKEREG